MTIAPASFQNPRIAAKYIGYPRCCTLAATCSPPIRPITPPITKLVGPKIVVVQNAMVLALALICISLIGRFIRLLGSSRTSGTGIDMAGKAENSRLEGMWQVAGRPAARSVLALLCSTRRRQASTATAPRSAGRQASLRLAAVPVARRFYFLGHRSRKE